MDVESIQLSDWQRRFVQDYLGKHARKSLLQAPIGSGKTAIALRLARELMEDNKIDSVMVISEREAVRQQWRGAGLSFGRQLEAPEVERDDSGRRVFRIDPSNRVLFIVDEPCATNVSEGFVEESLEASPNSRALYLSRRPLHGSKFDAEYRFDSELVFGSALQVPEIEQRIAICTPSFSAVKELLSRGVPLEEMNWRMFEKLVAELLEARGYEVKLMQGSKDGGVDILATKSMGESGAFRAVWQAKRLSRGRKVQLPVIRELADTVNEQGASKGIIVTSTFLTKGALERVERDRFRLGKVDKDDLEPWIREVFFASL